MRSRRPLLLWTLLITLPVCYWTFAAGEEFDPAQIDGLEAWYRADSLSLPNKGTVDQWPDDSGNGHDLTDDKNGVSATFLKEQLNGHSVVLVQGGNSYSVTQPFTMGPNTVFVVFQADFTERAFFRSATDKFSGVILRRKGSVDQFQNGEGDVRDYSTASATQGYTITVLGRDAGELKAFVNGLDKSTNVGFEGAMEIGSFFKLDYTRMADTDGRGLRIAEMLFYKRYLGDQERASVTRYLADRYGIEAAAAAVAATVTAGAGAAPSPDGGGPTSIAQLTTDSEVDVNKEGVAIPWTAADFLDTPFAFDTSASTRLTCTRDNTRVRLYVSLPLNSAIDGANVSAYFHVNGSATQRGQGISGVISEDGSGSVRAETITTLNKGDYVEVVTFRFAAEGKVTIEPGFAVFIAEVK